MSLPTTKETLDKARRILTKKDVEIKFLGLKIERLEQEVVDLRGMLGEAHDLLDAHCPNHRLVDEIAKYYEEKGE